MLLYKADVTRKEPLLPEILFNTIGLIAEVNNKIQFLTVAICGKQDSVQFMKQN